MLNYKGANIDYYDPFVNTFRDLRSIDLLAENIKKYDAVLITTDHTKTDYDLIGKYASLVIDTRNIMSHVKKPKARIIMA